MIVFTVMDHDVLTANDFAGEAFLALGNIPGVADYSTSVENFHGLKTVDLPLMQQTDKSKNLAEFLSSGDLMTNPYSIFSRRSSNLADSGIARQRQAGIRFCAQTESSHCIVIAQSHLTGKTIISISFRRR